MFELTLVIELLASAYHTWPLAHCITLDPFTSPYLCISFLTSWVWAHVFAYVILAEPEVRSRSRVQGALASQHFEYFERKMGK